MDSCAKILRSMMEHKDAGPFLEPVKWKEWGLLDYPKVIKNMMDLTTAKVGGNGAAHTGRRRARGQFAVRTGRRALQAPVA